MSAAGRTANRDRVGELREAIHEHARQSPPDLRRSPSRPPGGASHVQ